MSMKSNRAAHEKETSSPDTNRKSRQSVGVTRRRFLATSAVGVAGLGALGSAGSAAAANDEHTLVIEGFGSPTSYSFTVGDNLKKARPTVRVSIATTRSSTGVPMGRSGVGRMPIRSMANSIRSISTVRARSTSRLTVNRLMLGVDPTTRFSSRASARTPRTRFRPARSPSSLTPMMQAGTRATTPPRTALGVQSRLERTPIRTMETCYRSTSRGKFGSLLTGGPLTSVDALTERLLSLPTTNTPHTSST